MKEIKQELEELVEIIEKQENIDEIKEESNTYSITKIDPFMTKYVF